MPYPCSPRRDLSNALHSSSNGGRTRKLGRFPSRLRPSRGDSLRLDLRERHPPLYMSLGTSGPGAHYGPVILAPKGGAQTRTEGGAVSYTHLRAHETRHDLV